MTDDINYGGIAGRQLRSIFERIERLNEEIAALKGDVAEIFLEAKSNGFDPKTIRAILKLRKMSEAERAEQEALIDIYMHAIGMAADTALGDAARKRWSEPDPDETKDAATDEPSSDHGEAGDNEDCGDVDVAAEDEPVHPVIGERELEEARELGATAAREGVVVLKNPFVAGDPRRAVWDAGWCAEVGSDGMDIPKAFRRTKPKKPAKTDRGAGDDGEGGAS